LFEGLRGTGIGGLDADPGRHLRHQAVAIESAARTAVRRCQGREALAGRGRLLEDECRQCVLGSPEIIREKIPDDLVIMPEGGRWIPRTGIEIGNQRIDRCTINGENAVALRQDMSQAGGQFRVHPPIAIGGTFRVRGEAGVECHVSVRSVPKTELTPAGHVHERG
jgi:hypothetical protein